MAGRFRRGLALIAIGSLLVSCSSSGPTAGPVSATVKEWQISLSSTNLKAGEITFNIKNDGDKEHEFVVRKTADKADALPTNDDGTVVEDSPDLSEVGDPSEVAEIKSGSSDRSLTVTLAAGHYVIFCNLHVEDLVHYQKGMHIDFTVS